MCLGRVGREGVVGGGGKIVYTVWVGKSVECIPS